MDNFQLTFSYEISNLTSSTLAVISDNLIPLRLPENFILILKEYLNIFWTEDIKKNTLIKYNIQVTIIKLD